MSINLSPTQSRLQSIQEMLARYSEQVSTLNSRSEASSAEFDANCQSWQVLKTRVLSAATNLSNYYQEFQIRFPELLTEAETEVEAT